MDTFQKSIHQIVTLIDIHWLSETKYGTGFFYWHLSDSELKKEPPAWFTLDRYFLITSKHCVCKYNSSKFTNELPEKITINYTFPLATGGATKISADIPKSDLIQHLLFHKNEDVDIVISIYQNLRLDFRSRKMKLN